MVFAFIIKQVSLDNFLPSITRIRQQLAIEHITITVLQDCHKGNGKNTDLGAE